MKNYSYITIFSFTLFNILFFNTIKAQKNIVDAEVRYKNSTTEVVQIDFRDWQFVPKEIPVINSDKLLSPLNTETISIKGKNPILYKGKVLDISIFKNTPGEYAIGIDLPTKKDTVFMTALVVGKLSLYKYRDNSTTLHYFIEKERKFEELSYHFYHRNKNTKSFLASQKYKGQLVTMMQDCPDLHFDLQNEDFSEKMLIEYVYNYNKCINANINYKDKAKKSKLEYRAKLGIGLTKNLVKNNVNNESFNFGAVPIIGLSILRNFEKNLGRNSLQLDLYYSKFKTEAKNISRIENTNFIAFAILYRREFVVFNQDFHAKVGYNNSLRLSHSSISNLRSISGVNHGLLGGMGFSMNKVEIDLMATVLNANTFKKEIRYTPISLSLNAYYKFL